MIISYIVTKQFLLVDGDMFDHFKVYFKLMFSLVFLVVIAALALEYYYMVSGCKLCVYQRVVYIIIMALCLVGLFLPFLKHLVAIVILTLFALNAFTAVSQVMMERGVVSVSSSCTGAIPASAGSLEEFRKEIVSNDYIPCDIPPVTFLGMSMAGYSAIFSLNLTLFSLIFVSVFLFYRYGDKEAAQI